MRSESEKWGSGWGREGSGFRESPSVAVANPSQHARSNSIREAVRKYVVAHDLRYGSTTKYGQAGGIYHNGFPVNVDDLADTVMAVSPLQICFGERE